MEKRNKDTWLEQIRSNKAQSLRAYRYWERFLKPHDETWVLANKTSEDWGSHLVDFRDFLSRQPKQRGEGFLSDNTTKTLCNSIRAYLKHVGVTLQLTRSQKLALQKVESTPRIDFPMNIRIKEKLLSVANEVEDYIVSCGVSFGLRIGDFLTLTRGRLEPLLDNDIPIPIGKIQTEKVGEPAYPFISSDAKQSIIRMLKLMDSMKRTSPKELVLKKTENQINDILKELFKKAKIGIGDYTIRFHILRKFLSDNLSAVSSGDKWKRIVGKKAKSPYIANECKEAYKRVLPLIDCNGNRLRGNSHIEALRITVKEQERQIVGLETRLKETHEIVEETRTQMKQLDGAVQAFLSMLEQMQLVEVERKGDTLKIKRKKPLTKKEKESKEKTILSLDVTK
jgi:uncharacterized coiled-coil protein SlyX